MNDLKNRRMWTGIAWAALNYIMLYLQPVLNLNVDLCNTLMVNSTYVAGGIVIGLSMTDYAYTRYGNGNGGAK